MKSKFILVSVLFIAWFTALSQEKRPRKSIKQTASVIEKGLIKVAVFYPYSEGKTFNMEYYEARTCPWLPGF
jgi:hypothetical protein